MSFHWEVVKFFDLGNFILSTKMDEATVIDMHKTQVTQTLSLLGTKTKIIFNISCDHLGHRTFCPCFASMMRRDY
jgi:hypothetical protein